MALEPFGDNEALVVRTEGTSSVSHRAAAVIVRDAFTKTTTALGS